MNVRQFVKVLVLSTAVAAGGCSADSVGSSDEALQQPLHQGGGAGAPIWKSDPCADPNLETSAGVKESVQNGVHVFVGTDHADVIVGYKDGPNLIWGNDGDDILCGGDADDEIHGGDGDDYIQGGAGNDLIYADAGNDLVHGGAGGDEIHGGDGDDVLFGDLLDDKIWGDDGNDLIIGGHGTDEMHGGNGDDWLRGDTGDDTFDGGPGTDVASFMTAMPPTEDEPGKPHASDGIDGVIVNFNDPCMNPNDPSAVHHDGCAFGDGKYEPLDGIEIVVGSPYNDHFISSEAKTFIGGPGDDVFDVPASSSVSDGPGNDTWNGKPYGKPGDEGVSGEVFVGADENHERDFGVYVVGTAQRDVLVVHPNAKQQLQVDAGGSTKLHAGPGCTQQGAMHVVCDVNDTLRYVAVYGADGNDDITFQGNFPRDFTAHANGGPGDDTIHGGGEMDVLFTGISGEDWLYGGDGDDALLSESEPSFDAAKLKSNVPYTDGADHLFGEGGNDQLVADFPCGGHFYSGGPGRDIAGFARSGKLPIDAQLGAPGDVVSVKKPFYGIAYNPEFDWKGNHTTGAFCDVTQGTHLAGDLEILEASSSNDDLWGNDLNNTIWGREGDDSIHGLGGDDVLAGLGGDDEIWGDAGNDTLEGGEGFDILHGADGQRDILLCGPGGGKVGDSDSHDEITGCKY